MTKPIYKMAIVAPTCFYYQVALFRKLAAHPRIDLTVYYCSDEALRSQDVNDMYHSDGKWGDNDELLVGYCHKFLPNHSPNPSYLKWPFGLVNVSIWKEIKENKPDIVVIMSWMNVTWWLAIVACLRYGIPFLYMTDGNFQKELLQPRWKRWVKSLILGRCIFRLAAGFLCSGTANQQLFRFYGVPEYKLVPFAYSWGYESHLNASEELRPQRKKLRAQQGIPEDTFVILYCGRLSPEKSPMDLMEAYKHVSCPRTFLHIVGDGVQMESLQEFKNEHGLDSVRISGFQNRKEIAKYFATADLLVLPSKREGWGIVVNEALCFGLPVIASDQVGAALDLVREGENGFIFPNGDTQALAARIQQVLDLPEDKRQLMSMKSRDRINWWINRNLTESLDQYFDSLYSQRLGSKGNNPGNPDGG